MSPFGWCPPGTGSGVGGAGRVATVALVVGLLPVLTGCYSWRPVEPEGVLPGDRLRVELTRQAAAALPAGAFPLGGTTLRGSVATGHTGSPSNLLLRVTVGETREGILSRSLGQELEVAPPDMIQLHRRTFEPVRTGISVVGAAGVAVILFQAFGDVENEPDPDPSVPPGEGFRIPLFSFPVR